MPALLAATVQDSKAQRQERLKTRFRDRGGIFVPSEVNPLVDILLAREVNGESPVKKRASRKSAVTPKPRASTASRTARTKTPRPGPSKRAARKSAAVPSEGDENHLPPARKRRGASKTSKSKLQEGKGTDGINTGASAGPSRPRAAAQRRSFADQLADANPCSSSIKVRPVVPVRVPGTPPPPGKNKTALGKCKTNLEPVDVEPMCATNSIKLPAFIALERQRREKQEGYDLGGSDSDSDEPLAKKHAAAKLKSTCASAGTLTKPSKCKQDAPPPPKKRSKSKVKGSLGMTEDLSDQATNLTETKGAGLEEKNAPNVDSDATTRVGADLDGRARNAQVLQEKTVPLKVPRKRKEHREAAPDKDDNDNEDTHGPPEKKRRRANNTASRGKKENKEMSKSAREASVKVKMDKPIPSPMKQTARAHPQPASKKKAKTAKPPSRAGSAVPGTRSRGLPLSVRRRIKAITLNLPAIDDVDDPIDFLR